MSGLRVQADLTDDLVFDVAQPRESVHGIIQADDSPVFMEVDCGPLRCYLNVWRSIIDIDSPATRYFDVKEWFCQAVPTVLYVKWAFRDVCWTSLETNACLIVDDPLLKPRYGFLRFQEAVKLMDKHNFTTTIAFIPWNSERTDAGTVQLLRRRSDRFSLCVHGCDHTEGEFGEQSAGLLNRKIKTGTERMNRLSDRTSLQFDRVMVFPQGVYSQESGRALKLNGFLAAANTVVEPSNAAGNKTKIVDLWSVAITKYDTFPVFTRRYPAHGIENFAFDALLGKPCLIVAHHDVFKDHGRDLVDFIARLNSLNWNLRWRTLGDAIRRSFIVRRQEDETTLLRMFAETAVLECPFATPCEVVFIKDEPHLECVKAVMVNQVSVDFGYEAGCLQFKTKLNLGETLEVHVLFSDKLDLAPENNDISYRVRTGTRRYLSEFRDNYLSHNELLYKTAIGLRQLLK